MNDTDMVVLLVSRKDAKAYAESCAEASKVMGDESAQDLWGLFQLFDSLAKTPIEQKPEELDQMALEYARRTIDEQLVNMRDSCLSILYRNNGFVIKNYDGTPSDIIRLGTREGLEIGVTAYLGAVKRKSS